MAGWEERFIDRWRSLRHAEAALDAACVYLASERPLGYLLISSFAIATAYCVWLFDFGFLTGTSAYWGSPGGDTFTHLAGYLFFQRDTWQLPLFHVTKLGAPAGVNIIFTDSVPWVALAGRLVFRATGAPVNLYGAWTAMCFVASAVALTGLVAALGQRNIASAATATIAGLTMPALLFRVGQVSALAQFEILLALIFYLRNRSSGASWRLFRQAAALSLLALWTQVYFLAMVMGIVFATIAQSVANGALKLRSAAAVLLANTALLGGVMVLSGHLPSRESLGAYGFGFFSMNLLSPVFPQMSGLAASLRNFVLDPTGGQYEGFNYLGFGVLLLSFATVLKAKALQAVLIRNPWLFAVLVGFTFFALSNVVYFWGWKVLELPLYRPLAELASLFRSSGRFFWPVAYAMTALAIAAAIPLYGQRGVMLLLMAAALQWIDTAPLRLQASRGTSAAARSELDIAAWRTEIGRHRFVRVLPEFSCLAQPARERIGWNREVALEIELAAAFADRPTNSVYAARDRGDCAAKQAVKDNPQLTDGELTVYLNEFAGIDRVREFAAKSGACSPSARLVICSGIPDEASRLANLAPRGVGETLNVLQ